MAKRRHKAEQIIAKLREAEVELAKGQPISKVVRKLGITEQRAGPPALVAAYWPNAMTCSMADLTRRGQPRGRWILGGLVDLAILPPALLRLGITAYAAGHYGTSLAAQESLDQDRGGPRGSDSRASRNGARRQ